MIRPAIALLLALPLPAAREQVIIDTDSGFFGRAPNTPMAPLSPSTDA
jgi:hypothetical protein